ncbi:MAG: YciI family protein [Candidatus Devosia phytovorans]|uniref:YciI family protein n=1 Tax=Candidatus Devosia phytovorans TaxID=3121372 RepID=A0AAJ6B0F5_9HYPH|nr:YciI family protein [Devosia sp.]WEK05197.1 MAG: YciI family protein [Devosia sp.]
MRYMMIIHHDDEALAQAPQQELWTEYAAFNQALEKAGDGFSSGQRLTGAKGATVVRSRAGKTEVLDGPYADTREQLAGYFFIEVPTIEEAVEWANRCPSTKYGTVEIRPIVEPGAS